jgi:phenylacetate-CoA ligase
LGKGDRIITTYGAGPFVAGVTLDAFNSLGLCHIPVGAGNTEKLMGAVQNLSVDAIALTPSYALHLAEWALQRGIDLKRSSVKRLLVAGEPGGGEAELRGKLQDAWGAQVTEAMGIGDISVSLWGECEARQGMHFSGRGLVHFELIDPVSGAVLVLEDGVEGELVYTHLRQQATPLLRFRSRDHVRVAMGVCSCGRTSPRVRCIGRTDDMLIVRGVNVFPTALREVVAEFAPATSGVISVRPSRKGVKQEPPLRVIVEGQGIGLAGQVASRVREKLIVTVAVELAPIGSLPRSDYKSKLVEWPKEG